MGIKGAVHVMSGLFDTNFDSVDRWSVQLVDVSNAFNSLNQTAMLLHAHVLWPHYCHYLFNTYYGWSVVVLWGSSEFLHDKEGEILYQCLCMLLVVIHSLHKPVQWRHKYGMQTMLLLVNIWKTSMSGSLSFVLEALTLVTFPSLQRVSCLFLINIGLLLKDCSVVWVLGF